MDLFELKAVIRQIKREIKCLKCHKPIKKDDNIYLMASINYESEFHMRCEHCGAISMVHASIDYPPKKLKVKPLTNDDVLDMKIFLSEVKGDFTKYLK